MKLLWSSRSPFARKVMVAAHELGMVHHLALDSVVVATDKVNPDVMTFNPLNQIPTLVRDDGSVLLDSAVIVEYLNSIFGGDLLPERGEHRWSVLRLQALGDGLSQLNRARLAEARRGEHASAAYNDAFAAKSRASLDQLEKDASSLEPLSIGSIAVAVALSHLDFRFPGDGWREGRPQLAEWHEVFCERPSMRATELADLY